MLNVFVLQLALTVLYNLPQVLSQVHLLLPSIPAIGSTVCRIRPYDCEINCPFGYKVGVRGNCRCACVSDPCEMVECELDQICRRNYNGTAQCVPQTGLKEIYWKPGKCPDVVKTECLKGCSGDSDCKEEQKCCSSGCGRECMTPIQTSSKSTIVPLISITVKPVLLENVTSSKIGFCPPKNSIPNKNCNNECQQDSECSGVEKCCDNGCGKVCSPPDKATHCVHLLSAVNRLPKKSLANGFIPVCTDDGNFERIQCDKVHCWCVDVTQGWEIPGTSVLKEDGRPNCQVPRECTNVVCLNPCPHGLKTQQDGCPVANCECKNICDDIECNNPMEACQLVEPDCAEPPCLPLPRCLLNPCPRGLPMTLPNGVTALCTRSTQCSSNFWCHEIGYNGLGFCCATPESAIREGHCPARIPKQSDNCESDCRSDAECKIGSKCCFDGCGLKCIPISFPPNPFETKQTVKTIETQEPKRVLSSLLAECPENNPHADQSKCEVQCQNDSDCSGMKRCCSSGCSSLCTYPTKTTACIHDVITHEVYKTGRLPKCDSAGNYEQQQCDSFGCFCVDVNTGKLIPFSRQSIGTVLVCDEVSKNSCSQFKCDKNCSYGYEVDEDGCELCECKNPCNNLECSSKELCIMLPVECYQKNHCPPQPRCVPNICPTGIPFSSFADVTDLCSNDAECPDGYWCNLVGLNKKGFCCLEPRKNVSPGLCPQEFITLDTTGLQGICDIRCKSDSDCQFGTKCCFNGCGTDCIATNIDELQSVISVKSTNNLTGSRRLVDKNWQCPKTNPLHNCTEEVRDLCTSDLNCPGTQKCCSFGCGRMCSYPQKAPACIHLKAALQRIGANTTANCKEDGSFELIQCNEKYCWCSSSDGKEIEGTRVSSTLTPTCDSRRLCPQPKCSINVTCPYGRELDASGCCTCKCFNPCKDIVCPGANEFCVPNAVECTTASCFPVPLCVAKACSKSLPVIDEVTFEPLLCKENNQCKYLGRPAYCRLFKSDGGYCCWGNGETLHAGKCPAESASHNFDCVGNCISDEDCLTTEKCCYNGCGLSCMPADQYAPIRSRTNKIGECLVVPETEPLNCASSSEDLCGTDEDCPGVQKCCLHGCYKQCSYAQVTTACLHAQAAAEAFKETMYIPQCDPDGEFLPIQISGESRFCVDKKGREVQGTRSNLRIPNCHLPRSCPISSCTLHCPLGYRKDSNGCNQCACFDPCDGVKCLKTQICRVVEQDCYTKNCSPFPKCIVNACPKGDPLVSLDTQQLAVCTFDGQRSCPAGYYCHRIGLFKKDTGYCCVGDEADPPAECPVVPELAIHDIAKCAVHCRAHSECDRGICCFNGCGTYCKQTSIRVSEISAERVPAPSHIVPSELRERLGVCPVNPMSNPGCRSECMKDSECPQFHKCCSYGCGRLCQYPRVATVCIHRVAHGGNAELLTPTNSTFPQCTSDGLFKMIQCDRESRFCWCVNVQTGVELTGTRTLNIGNNQPNCFAPRSCAVTCGNKCVYGVRLDGMGCPMNGVCECRNPCEDLKCPRFDDVCVLKPVACLSSVCSPVPVCKSNPCVGGEQAIKDRYGNSIPCIRDEECGREQCQYVLGEQQLGVCCPRKQYLTSQLTAIKRGECPVHVPDGVFITQNCTHQCASDMDCEDVEKCCEYGCNKVCMAPTLTTNCIHLRSAILALQKSKAIVTLNMPNCDAISGMFNPVQCDASDLCWCVDTVTGHEFYGTKTKLFSTGLNVCSSKRSCSISCEERGMVCPFGLETDSTGCALDADCRCRNPCASVQCQAGYVCVLRPKECSDQICVPVPTCEKNWCANGRKPAVEPRTYTQFTCLENRTQICPSGFYCTGYDHVRRGICCPGQEKLSPSKASDSCPHGDAFSNSPDGSPLKCSVNTNGCPSTHYCSSKPTESTGICCVTKRYVCNLKLDAGPCTVSVPRFYYDAENQTCLPFNYGGCSGNLNNFGSKSECERFCVGTGVDPLLDFMNDDSDAGKEVVDLGFSIVGPFYRKKNQADFEMAILDYLRREFNVGNSEIKNFSMHDYDYVRFSIYGPDSHAKASNISSAVSNGTFIFKYGGNTYRAEPHSWFSHQVAERANTSHLGVFWTLVAASIVFGLAIFVALLFACFFMYRQSKQKDNASSFRGVSPTTNYATNMSYAASAAESPFSDTLNDQQKLSQRQLQVFTTDDMDQVKRAQQSDEWDESSSDEHTQGGRRLTRTTLYY